MASAGTAAQVERVVRAWRRVDRIDAAKQTERRHLARHLTMWVDDDGMLVLRGRLTPEAGAIVQRALEAAADRLFQDSRGTAADGGITEEVTPGQRRADALAVVAGSALAGGLDRGRAGDRYQVVVHVDAATLQDASTSHAGGRLESPEPPIGTNAGSIRATHTLTTRPASPYHAGASP